MSSWMGMVSLVVLSGCASNNLPKTYATNKEMGVFYSSVSSIHYALELILLFENVRTKEKKEHTVKASAFSRDTFVVTELKPGKWMLKTITLCIPDHTQFFPIKDTLDIGLEIENGKANFFPGIEFKEDCHIPLITSAGTVLEEPCKKYEMRLLNNKKELDARLAGRYPKIAPDDSDSGAIASDNLHVYHRVGGFEKTYVKRALVSFDLISPMRR